jgi:hypothetical protein
MHWWIDVHPDASTPLRSWAVSRSSQLRQHADALPAVVEALLQRLGLQLVQHVAGTECIFV